RRIASWKEHDGAVFGVAFSRDGRRLASVGYEDRTLVIRDLDGGAPVVRVVAPDSLYTVAWDGAGDRVVTGSDDRSATVWDARTGARVARLEHPGVVRAASIDRAGGRVA